jgi:type IV secretory pathway VirB6-like protein
MKKILLLIILIATSCSPTLKIKELDAKTGKLPTETILKAEEILVSKKIDLKLYNQFLYVKKSGLNMEQYEKYIFGTLKNIGGFQAYYIQTELEQMVIQKGLTDKVTSISDNIGLLNLSKNVGNFLICENNVEYKGGYDFTFEFKVINPVNAEILLHIKHNAFNWAGLDRPMFNPVFNQYIDWLKDNQK